MPKFKKLFISLRYYFFEIQAPLWFKIFYFSEKFCQFLSLIVGGLLRLPIPYPFFIRNDYLIKNSIGTFYIKAYSDFDYPIQPYVEDEHVEYWDVKDGSIFLDVGAHVGIYSIKFLHANRGKNITTYCFEPNASTFPYLIKNIELNNLTWRVIPVNRGLYSRSWSIGFTNHIPRDAAVSKIVEVDNDNVVNIQVSTLDEFLREFNIDIAKIGLIKIDVEWFEEHVLRWGVDFLSQMQESKIICEILDIEKKKRVDLLLNEYGLQSKPIDEFNYLIFK